MITCKQLAEHLLNTPDALIFVFDGAFYSLNELPGIKKLHALKASSEVSSPAAHTFRETPYSEEELNSVRYAYPNVEQIICESVVIE